MDLKGWLSEFGGVQESGFFTRKHYILHNENFEKNKAAFVRSCNNTDIYECIYHYKDKNVDECEIIGDPYLDFDIDDIDNEEEWKKLVTEIKYVINYIETAMGIAPEELRIYFSGSKGFHVIIPHDIIGLVPSKDLNEQFRFFAMGIAYIYNGKTIKAAVKDPIDTGIYDRRRLFRLPNSINSKSGRYKVPVSIDQLYDLSREEILKWALEPHEETPQQQTRKRSIAAEGYEKIVMAGQELDARKNGKRRCRSHHKKMKLQEGERIELLPCTMRLLESGAQKGNRNHSCFALASSLFQAGYKIEEVYEAIEEWNDKCDVPLSDREMHVTVNSACSSYEHGMVVGCGKYRDLDLCDPECKILGY